MPGTAPGGGSFLKSLFEGDSINREAGDSTVRGFWERDSDHGGSAQSESAALLTGDASAAPTSSAAVAPGPQRRDSPPTRPGRESRPLLGFERDTLRALNHATLSEGPGGSAPPPAYPGAARAPAAVLVPAASAGVFLVGVVLFLAIDVAVAVSLGLAVHPDRITCSAVALLVAAGRPAALCSTRPDPTWAARGLLAWALSQTVGMVRGSRAEGRWLRWGWGLRGRAGVAGGVGLRLRLRLRSGMQPSAQALP